MDDFVSETTANPVQFFTLGSTKVETFVLFRATQPEQVWYGGAVVGAHAMKHFDEIGSKITHTYQVGFSLLYFST